MNILWSTRTFSAFVTFFTWSVQCYFETNLVKNGDFQQGLSFWVENCPSPQIECEISTTTYYFGNQSFHVSFDGDLGTTNFYHVNQIIPDIKPETTYVLRYYLKTVDRNAYSNLQYIYLTSLGENINCLPIYCNYNTASGSVGTSKWSKKQAMFTTTIDTGQLRIGPRSTDTSAHGEAYYDRIELYEVNSNSSNVFVLENEEISIKFDRSIGSITSLFDKKINTEYIQQGIVLPVLYIIRTKNLFHTTSINEISNTMVDSFNYQINDEQTRVNMVFAHGKTRVLCMVAFEGRNLSFNISVENGDDDVIIRSVKYPIFNINPYFHADETDYFLHSYHTGNLYKFISALPDTKFYVFMNPGQTSTQFMTYFTDTKALYFQTNDTDGNIKKFGFIRHKSSSRDYVEVFYEHFTNEGFGNNLLLDYFVNLKVLHREQDESKFTWYDFADIYKSWTSLAFNFTPIFDRLDIPSEVFKTNVMHVTFNLRVTDIFFMNNIMRELYISEPFPISKPHTMHMPGGYWGRPSTTWCGIDYFYPYDSMVPLDPDPNDPLYLENRKLLEIDSGLYLWLSGNKWDLWEKDENGNLVFNDTVDFNANDGDSHVIIRENGDKYYTNNRFCSATNTRLSAMMPINSDFMMDKVIVDNLIRGMRRNVTLMSIDQVVGGWVYPSWDERYPETMGYSQTLHAKFVELLDRINQIIIDEGVSSSFGLSLEETNEFYIPLLQFHMVRQARDGSFIVKGIENGTSTNIPVFSYVYSRYALGMDEYGQVFSKYYNPEIAFWWLARTVLQGNVPGVRICYNSTGQRCWLDKTYVQNETFHFFKKLVKYVDTSFRGSEMKNPGTNITGLPDDVIFRSKEKRSYFINFFFNPIQREVFKKKSGDLAYVFIHSREISDEVVNLSVEISKYDLVNVDIFNISLNVNGKISVIQALTRFTNNILVDFSMRFLDLVIIDIKIVSCNAEFSGPGCEYFVCNGASSYVPGDACSNHGICTRDGCECTPGWMGYNCQVAQAVVTTLAVLFSIFLVCVIGMLLIGIVVTLVGLKYMKRKSRDSDVKMLVDEQISFEDDPKIE